LWMETRRSAIESGASTEESVDNSRPSPVFSLFHSMLPSAKKH
jgi:hypothetical protein